MVFFIFTRLVNGMLKFYKSANNTICEVDGWEVDCWINVTAPEDVELEFLKNTLAIDPMFLTAAADEEESSRTEISDNGEQILVVIDTPYAQRQGEHSVVYTTMPLGVIVTKQNIITISLRENAVIKELTDSMVKGVNTQFKTRFLFIILYRIAIRFLQHLKQIDRIENLLEQELRNSMRNKELLHLLEIEKSLVYFSTSLKANQITIERILRGRVLKIYEEDQDLLEDVLTEIKQGVDMSNIYSGIVTTTMNSYSSIISNNLNAAMKFLTSMTILLAIPTMISSFYGMNVKLPVDGDYAFLCLIVLSLLLTFTSYFILKQKDLLS
ncbi:MAG: magnesium transporter CorA family protein [Oscillospiraceae bacterium]|jgi:magnesium transporter|nr:magnesium transporter CorA family protein [Oscillospiraceae bacterium]